MPLYHCKDCHHEWEEIKRWRMPKCEWCGGDSYVLEEETPLEKMCNDLDKRNWKIESAKPKIQKR